MSDTLIECDIGDRVLVTGTLKDNAGDTVTGATVTARALQHGATTEVNLGTATDQGDGVYSVEFAPTAAGRWHVRLESDDPTQVAEEGVVYVRHTTFTTS